eukprot:GEMP01021517.1.p1 GENE.GEMP01021517.1~~GEMP01021517.1.p1  ORF type:complete len:468 (+),score=110.69 GEMP01021517.1:94-1497(+)
MFSWARVRTKREVKEEDDEDVGRKRAKREVKTEVSRSAVKRTDTEEARGRRVKLENNMLVLADVSRKVKRENNMLVLAEGHQPKAALPERRASKKKVKAEPGVKRKKKKQKRAKQSDARRTMGDKLMTLSPALQKIVGTQKMGLNSLISCVWQTMKARGLQNPSDGREMILDEELSSLFGYQKCGMLDLRSLVRPHIECVGAPEVSQELVKSERIDAKQEIKREPSLLAKKEQIKTKQEPNVGRQTQRRSQTISVDTSSDTDVYSITSTSSSSSSVRPTGSSTAAAECSSDEAPSQADEPMRARRVNVEIQSMSAKTFYFFVSDEELAHVPPDTLLTASLVMKARIFSGEYEQKSSDEQTIEGKVTRTEDGYDVSFTELRPNRRYDLYIWDTYHFQIPLRAIRDFTIAASAEFCAFFYPPLADDVRHAAMDGDTLAHWKLENLVALGVDEESATRILEVIRDCLSGM